MLQFFNFASLIVVIFFLTFIRCTKSNSPISQLDSSYIPNPNIDIPLEVGNEWIYSVFDTVTNYTDTVEVLITEYSYQAKYDYKIRASWYYWSDGFVYSVNIQLKGDTLYFPFPGFSGNKFIFPLSVGNSWKTNSGEYYVKSQDSLHVPFAFFESSFNIQSYLWEPNCMVKKNIYLVPSIGIVKMYYYWYCTFSGPVYKRSYELILSNIEGK